MTLLHWVQKILARCDVVFFFLYRKEEIALWCVSVLVGKNLNVFLSLLFLPGEHKEGGLSKEARPLCLTNTGFCSLLRFNNPEMYGLGRTNCL
jgi:hypothetical protein